MSYKKIYEALKEYEPKRLVGFSYKNKHGCCAVGVLASRPEELPPLSVSALFYANQPLILEIMQKFGCTIQELNELQDYNDEGDHARPEERYLNVLKFLERKIAEEKP